MQRVPFMFMTNPVCRLNLGLTTRTKGGSRGYCSGKFISFKIDVINSNDHHVKSHTKIHWKLGYDKKKNFLGRSATTRGLPKNYILFFSLENWSTDRVKIAR